MKFYHTEADYNRGVSLLETYIYHITDGVEFDTASTTTNSFETFKKEFVAKGKLTISREGCDNTIYTLPYTNLRARVWHDLIHLELNAPFDITGEALVCEMQMERMYKWLTDEGYTANEAEYARQILYGDIMGQAEYYEKYNRFVPYQKLFVKNRFLNQY